MSMFNLSDVDWSAWSERRQDRFEARVLRNATKQAAKTHLETHYIGVFNNG